MGLFCNHKELNDEIKNLNDRISNMREVLDEATKDQERLKRDLRYMEEYKKENSKLLHRVLIAENQTRYLEDCFKQITQAHEAMKNV